MTGRNTAAGKELMSIVERVESVIAAKQTMICRPPDCRCRVCLLEENAALKARLNTPEIEDFARGVVAEAQHQRARFASDHDAGKSALDWFWLIGYLAQKAAFAALAGDRHKALHHTISTAAALANWHAALSDHDTSMRPGIAPPAGQP